MNEIIILFVQPFYPFIIVYVRNLLGSSMKLIHRKCKRSNIKLSKSHKQLCPSDITTREAHGTKQQRFTIHNKSQTPELFIEQHTLVSLPYHRFHPKSM